MFASVSVAGQWIGIAASVVAILAGLLAGLRYFVRQILTEMRPNGGDSERAGDILLRAGTAIGEMQKEQRQLVAEVRAQTHYHWWQR